MKQLQPLIAILKTCVCSHVILKIHVYLVLQMGYFQLMHARAKTSNFVEYNRRIPQLRSESGVEAELIYYPEYPYLPFPASQTLLRYMDFWKFEDLVRTGELYFTRADKFLYPLEGSLANPAIRGFQERDLAIFGELLESDLDREMAEHLQWESKIITFVSCWHMNESPSDRMWNLYAGSPESVVIFTTAGQLLQSLTKSVVASPVRYVDYDMFRGGYNHYNLFLHKDKMFSHEKEFRLITDLFLQHSPISPKDPKDFYRRMPLDVSLMVNGVELHPEAPAELRQRVEDLTAESLPRLCVR